MILLPHNPGDVVMGLYALSRLRATYPHAEINFIVSEECLPLVEGHPHLNKVFIIPAQALKGFWEMSQFDQINQTLKNFINDIKKNHHDLLLNLFQDNYGALLASLIDCKKVVGYTLNPYSNYQVKGRFMEHLFAIPVARKQNPWHVIDIFLRSFGGEGDKPPAVVFPPLKETPDYFGDIPSGNVLFQMGTAWEGKKWPREHWINLFRHLMKESWPITFIGAKEESGLYQDFCADLSTSELKYLEQNSFNLIGKTSLLDVYYLAHLSKWLVTGDTVSMHLAASTPCKVIALFGSSNPIETGPYGKENFIFQTELEVPETLPFLEPSQNLKKILPLDIAQFMLQGKVTKGIYLWETRWDPINKMQILVDVHFSLHPFQKQSAALGSALQSDLKEHPQDPYSDAIHNVLRQINQCLIEPSKENISRLSSLDKTLAEETRHDVFWEAYRIHINGLPLDDPKKYFIQRKNRLLRCLHELNVWYEAS